MGENVARMSSNRRSPTVRLRERATKRAGSRTKVVMAIKLLDIASGVGGPGGAHLVLLVRAGINSSDGVQKSSRNSTHEGTARGGKRDDPYFAIHYP